MNYVIVLVFIEIAAFFAHKKRSRLNTVENGTTNLHLNY